jgi:dipeptidyl-peptidase 4
VGNRGGSPERSKVYESFGYYNLRDYALADKKAAIEQLAARHKFIDIERVGIYGHSGGGFLSAAAVLQKPFNEFFKVAVASAGNHDNNIYNQNWSEQHHGLREVVVTPPKTTTTTGTGTSTGTGTGTTGTGTGTQSNDDAADGAQDKQEQGTEKKDENAEKKDENAEKKDQSTEKKDQSQDKTEQAKPQTKFQIHVPTNTELAANLKGHLLLVHGDMDNNVHPAGTIRLVDALIKANKRFDMLILPGKAHGFANYQTYFTQRTWEFFAEHLLDHRPTGVDMQERREGR